MKFDENCERRVIRELQRDRGVALKKVGASRKHLIDDQGVRYVVLGGADPWHEIPRSIFEAEERASGDTLLVVAIPDGKSLDVFTGPLRPLLEHKDRLPIDKDKYIFHVHRFTSRLLVREVPSLELTRLEQRVPEERKRGRGGLATEGKLIRVDFRRREGK